MFKATRTLMGRDALTSIYRKVGAKQPESKLCITKHEKYSSNNDDDDDDDEKESGPGLHLVPPAALQVPHVGLRLGLA